MESGNLVADDLAFYDGAEDWVPLSEVPGVSAPAPVEPAHSSAPDWVPPRRDTLPPEPGTPYVETAATPPPVGVLPAPIQRVPTPAPTPNAAPRDLAPGAARSSSARPGGDPYRSALRAAAIKNMGIGGLFFVGGSAVTVFSYEAATENPHGGSYVMAWGAILFGGIQLVKGIIQFTKS